MFTLANNQYPHDEQYINNLKHIRDHGVDTPMRNMTCRKVHGLVGRYSMSNGIPVMMHKKIFDSFSKEMSWMTRGESNISTLGCKIWDQWADALGELGPVYGTQMRNQVFYKLAYTDAEFEKYRDVGGYKSFGVAELEAEHIIEEIGQERFDELVASGVLNGHTVDVSDGVSYEEYSVSLMRKKVDQLDRAIKDLQKVNETGIADRRVLISLWNNADYEMQALPPCHTIFHFVQLPIPERERYEWVCNDVYINCRDMLDELYGNHDDPTMAIRDHIESELHAQMTVYDLERVGVIERTYTMNEVLTRYGAPQFKLDLVLFMRSNDYPAGAPFNISGYAQVLIKMAQEVGMIANELIHFASDAHIYEDQLDAVETMIEQYEDMVKTKDWEYPTVELTSTSIKDMTHEDFVLIGYNHMPYVPVPVAA